MKTALKASLVGLIFAFAAFAVGGPNVMHFLQHLWGGVAIGQYGSQITSSGHISEWYDKAAFADAGVCEYVTLATTIKGAKVTDACFGSQQTDAGAQVELGAMSAPYFDIAYVDAGYGVVRMKLCDLQPVGVGATVQNPTAYVTNVRCFSTVP